MQKKVLIVGAKGMLGQALVQVFAKDIRYAVSEWDREEIDVTDASDAEDKIWTLSPDIIINASAYNAVDACEENDEEYVKAVGLNGEAPVFLVRVAKRIGALLVHYSTDYVFGDAPVIDDGFSEDATPLPNCRYAQSKLLGEKGVASVGGKYYIIRLSKLFGKPGASAIGKKSFFEAMLEAGKTKDEVNVVDDEMSCFTYAPDLAQASKDLVESEDAYGIYHLINESPVTWYDGVVELYKQAGFSIKVVPVTSETFPRPAKRPKFSVLRNTRRPLLRPYQEALGEFLSQA
ncbi:MAG: NAD(P)-dependent oxidoreductase [Candidatus Moranbacteria bacterium]|nr:NAD(P)-dependent oxidoreductase [Candidatus Moranbacteria bacterium]